MAILSHICISKRKGQAKTSVDEIELVENHGLRGDAHAGAWHRQVSLLDCVDIDAMKQQGLELPPGAFGENLAISGIDLGKLGIGSVLEIGESQLEFTQIGKVCHDRCAIYHTAGDCIMPRTGVFAKVTKGGTVRSGAEVRLIKSINRSEAQVAVITVSDRCSRGEAVDTSGPAVVDLVRSRLDAHIACSEIISDDKDALVTLLKDLSGRGIDIVFTSGGTGFTSRDITPEATREVIEREAPGLAEEMRRKSAEITPHALLQRGVCGIRGRCLIVNLPGSKKAAVENLSFILPALPHAIQHLRDQNVHRDQDRDRNAITHEEAARRTS